MGKTKDFLRKVSSKAESFRSESELAHFFLSELEDLCGAFGIRAEMRIEETLLKGRNDARIGGLAFEFKKAGRLRSQSSQVEAIEELRSHLHEYISSGEFQPSGISGFITDGILGAILRWNPVSGDFVTVDALDREVDRPSAFVPIEDSALMFERDLRGLGRRGLSPENLLEDFGPGSELCTSIVPVLWNTFQANADSLRVQTFYRQWRVLFSLATQKLVSGRELQNVLKNYGLHHLELREEEQVRQFLFILQSYYSSVLKLLAIHVADDLELLGQVLLIDAVVDDPPEGFRRAEESLPNLAANLVEKDIFSWFEEAWTKDLQGAVRELALRIRDYDVQGVSRDVFKRVYQNIIPPKLRKALGEFYTKDWAAELLLNEVGYDGSGSLLDPSCGSGTFLALAILRKKNRLGDQKASTTLKEITESVVGFDVNPVAVITARINYLLSIEDLLRAGRIPRGIAIPVYLCDSVVVPAESYDISHGKIYELHTAVEDIVGTIRLPVGKSLKGTSEGSELVLLKLLEEHVKRSEADFLKSVKATLGQEYELQFRPLLRGLHSAMVKLDREGVNGIWARFIQNFFAPVISPKFDFVVGNPPWVAPVHVPKGYRDLVGRVLAESGYMEPYEPNFGMAKARFPGAEEQYVACLPFVHRALTTYLKPGAKCAFLLTSSLVRLLNSGGWRERILGLNLVKVLDLTLITDIHEGASCWAFIPVFTNDASSHAMDIQYSYFVRGQSAKGSSQRRHLPEEIPELKAITWTTDRKSIRVDPRNSRSPWMAAEPGTVKAFRKMQQHPRLGDMYQISMGLKTSANQLFFLKDVEKGRMGDIIAKNLEGEQLHLEKSLVFPVCKGSDLRPWRFEPSYMILPHRAKKWTPLAEAEMKTSYPETFQYFLKNRTRLEDRTDYGKDKGPFYMVFRLSESKNVKWKVAYRDISTQLEACVIPETYECAWGKRDLLVDHSAYFVATNSESESYFVAGLLNSLPCRSFVQGLGRPKGGVPFIGIVQWMTASLPVPRFEPKNADHQEVVRLSRLAHKSSEEAGVEAEANLNNVALRVYSLSTHDGDSLGKHFRMLRGGL